jgi:hypothetical protein
MRITKIAGDFHDIGDRPCRVFCNEQEIEGWTVADDFRRVVETPGKVYHGAVRIDLAPLPVSEVEPEPAPEVVEAPAARKPSHHIPARKLKAGR